MFNTHKGNRKCLFIYAQPCIKMILTTVNIFYFHICMNVYFNMYCAYTVDIKDVS